LLQLVERFDEQSVKLERLEFLLAALVGASLEKPAFIVREFAVMVGLEPDTVQGHLREGRINGFKTHSGRGNEREWRISKEEYLRYCNEGLLPPRFRYRHPR
jgi:hypothetical protein